MPLGWGPNQTFTTSADIGGGRNYTRFKGPLLIGQVEGLGSSAFGGVGGPTGSYLPPHMVNVSTARGDFLLSVVSTFALQTIGVSSSAANVSTGSPTGLVYISMTTGAGNLMAAGSTANVPTGLPGGANGVALCWDQAKGTLAVYDPGTSGWLWPHQAASSNVALGGVITWSASSS